MSGSRNRTAIQPRREKPAFPGKLLLAQWSQDGRVICIRQRADTDEEDTSSAGMAIGEDGADLLDRAMVGWEHFLSTLQGEPDE